MTPLGLPTGSVRAILALLIISTICLLAVRAQTAPDWLLIFAGTAFGFYFGARSNSGAPPNPPLAPSVEPADAIPT